MKTGFSLSISQKIWLSIAILVAGYFCSTVFGFWGGRENEQRLRAVAEATFPAAVLSQSAVRAFRDQCRNYRDGVVFGEQEMLNTAQSWSQEVDRKLASIQALSSITEERREEVTKLLSDHAKFTLEAQKIYTMMIKSLESEALPPKAAKLKERSDKLDERFQRLKAAFAGRLQSELAEVNDSTRRRLYLDVAAFAVIVVLTLALVYVIVRTGIVTPLATTVRFADRMAGGELDMRLNFQRDDEVGHLGKALDTMAERLRNTIGELIKHREHLEEIVAERTKELEMDIAMRKQAELRFKTAFHSNAGLMIITTLEDGRIIEANESFSRTFRWDIDEICGKTTVELGLFKDLSDRQTIVSEVKKKGVVRELEIVCLARDGTEVDILFSTDLITMEDQEYLLSVCQDITQRKEAEKQLAAANKQLVDAALLAGKAEVATGVLHNVGNVLNSVGVTVAALRKQVAGSQSKNIEKLADLLDQHKADLATFVSQTEQGRKLPQFISLMAQRLGRERSSVLEDVEKLSDFIQHISEIVSLQQEYSKSVGLTQLMAIDEVIEDAVQISAGSLSRHGIALDIEPSGLPPIRLDRHKVLQILANLVNNARDALRDTEDGKPRISIRATKVNGDRVAICVKDNGVGIAEEDLKRIFNHGFTTKKTGHGFGLHSSANAAKEMGGSLNVTSEGKGKGAAFTLELPLNREESHNS